MFTHKHYVPILKWKLGEYLALERLGATCKDFITPLIEIQPIGYDHEAGQDRESIDSHLGDFARRLASKWSGRRCFVDARNIPSLTRMADGRHFVEFLFSDARSEGCVAVPVVNLSSDAAFLRAVNSVVRQDARGICLRLFAADFDRSNLTSDIEALLRTLGVSWADTDLVIDFGAQIFPARVILTAMGLLPSLNRWRSLTVAATSFPESLASVPPPFDIIQRHEWNNYVTLSGLISSGEGRIPTFSDYGVNHPALLDMDMRFIRPFAKLRYTIESAWHIGRGTTVRTDGFGQYRDMCALLRGQPYFDGPAFSAGDAYIDGCALGSQRTGNLSTWAWVGTNRHISKVVADLSSLYGP